MKVDTSEVYFVNVKCSGDATILLTDKGALYACGGNRYNRLGLDESKVILSSHVDKVLVPTRVRAVKQRIVDLDMGPNHTVCIAEDGKLVKTKNIYNLFLLCASDRRTLSQLLQVSMGRNSEAQLGRGQARAVAGPDLVKTMQDKEVSMVSCGATFTVAGTTENVLYFWGTRFISPLTRPNTRDAFSQTFGAQMAAEG